MANPLGIHTYREGVYEGTGGANTIAQWVVDDLEGIVAGEPADIQVVLNGSYPDATAFLLHQVCGFRYNGTTVAGGLIYDVNNGAPGAYPSGTVVRLSQSGGAITLVEFAPGLNAGRRLYWRADLYIAVQDAI